MRQLAIRSAANGYAGSYSRDYPLAYERDFAVTADGTITVPTQLEAITGAQLTTQLGFGHESIWKFIYGLNQLSGNQLPYVGAFALTPSAGAIQGEAGPLDAFDFSVRATDGDTDGQWSGTTGGMDVAANSFAMLVECKFTALPAGNRLVCGEDGTHDFFLQYMAATGRVRFAIVGGSTITSEVAVNHNDSLWHTALLVCDRTGANEMRMATELGTSPAVSVAALGTLTATGAPFIFRNANAPPGSVAYWAVAISDNSATQNTAIASLYSNIATAVANYRTATGR